MGYDASSKIVYGLKINEKNVNKEKQVRSCKHKVDSNAKYCSECGKPIYKTEQVELDYPDNIEFYLSDYSSNDVGILGFIVVGTKTQDTNYYEVPQPNQNKIKELKEFLIENSIKFKDEDLKSYLYTYHSY